MQRLKIWQVDAFAERAFEGNPAAVCVLERFPDDSWMQNVAAEMNLAETAFIVPLDASGHFQLRWFTPGAEVELCGHATLASAHILWEQGVIAGAEPIHFQTLSGQLTCFRDGDEVSMDFPATPPVPLDVEANVDRDGVVPRILRALRIERGRVFESKHYAMVVLDSEDAVRALKPNFLDFESLSPIGVIATARCQHGRYDFVSRFFAPKVGINEDPVTGSAHCCTAPYWANELGRNTLRAFQASPRGGIVNCTVDGGRVRLAGRAVTVLQGELLPAALIEFAQQPN